MSADHDDLLALLAPRPGSATDSAALLAATTGILRRRARVRRCAKAAGLVLVFAAGGAAGWVLKPTPEPEVVTVTDVIPIAVAVPLRPEAPEPSDIQPSPAALELLAEQAGTSADAAKLYRTAGDRYLTDAGDYEQAVRCYRLYFRHAGDAGRTVSADDSWLLMSLKTTKLKEKRDANSGT